MRKLVIGMTAVALGLSMAACQKNEPAANEAVVEEPLANETMDINMDINMDMNATDENAVDANATADANAAEGNAAE